MIVKFKNLFRSKEMLLFLYSLNSTFEIFNHKKKSRFKNTSISKLNVFMTKFYQQPEIAIDKNKYLIPFRFYTTNDYVLNGIQYISDFKSKKWIISLHDFGQNKYWSLYFARPFMELGYNVLSFDFINHGDNLKVKGASFGQAESENLSDAIEWLTNNKQVESIGIIGTGLGAYAANALYFDKPEFFTKNKVKFVIAESIYSSVESLIISYYQRKIKIGVANRSKKIAKYVNKIFNAAWNENHINLQKNNLINKFYSNHQQILQNYVPFFYTNFDLNDTYDVKDSLQLMLLRDDFDPKINVDKIVLYNFSKTNFLFKDHFKTNFKEMINFEKKLSKNIQGANKAIEKLKLTDNYIEKSNQENSELYTFKIDK